MQRLSKLVQIILAVFFLTACQSSNFDGVFKNSLELFDRNIILSASGIAQNKKDGIDKNTSKSLPEILLQSKPDIDIDKGFTEALIAAVDGDPRIFALRQELFSRSQQLNITKSGKEFTVSASVYGGLEDISDNTKGIAVVLNARRMLYDGGKLDASIVADQFAVDSARYQLMAKLDERLLEISNIWIELDKYQKLGALVESRIKVLDPLITQLEQVASVGEGDVTQVAAAQRTVSAIRVTQADITENLGQAKLKFLNLFGRIPQKVLYDGDFFSRLVPENITAEMIENAPGLLAQYTRYKAAEARLVSVKAKKDFDVGFESRATRPFASSGYDSEETVGLVLNKTLFNGDLFESEIRKAEANVKGEMAKVQSVYRDGERGVRVAQQTIASMDRAIDLAKKNAQITADEILYLRKQLIIGGSTLETVLASEARLYQAQSQEIEFIATRRKAELTIVSTLGLLAPALGIAVE